MPVWESIVVLVIWRMVRGWRRSKRSGRAVPNSQRYSQSSQPTVRNPNSVANADPERISHNGKCEWCGVEAVVPMVRTRIERRPWRLVWWCDVCGRQSRARVPVELVDVFVSWDRAGGTTLSMREVVEMVQVDLDVLNAAIEDELL